MNRLQSFFGDAHHDGLWARTANLLLSGWLVVSALAWDPSSPARLNGLVVGYLVFVFAAIGTLADSVRSLNTLLGLWLLASTWVFPAPGAERWNTFLVGVAMTFLSLVSRRGRVRPPPLRALLSSLVSSDGAR